MTSSSAMFFTDDNTVIMAWVLNMENSYTTPFKNEDGVRYEGRFRIGSFSASESRFTDSTDSKVWMRDGNFQFG